MIIFNYTRVTPLPLINVMHAFLFALSPRDFLLIWEQEGLVLGPEEVLVGVFDAQGKQQRMASRYITK
jgi:hypothetical protein